MSNQPRWIDAVPTRVYTWSKPTFEIAEVDRFLQEQQTTWRRTEDASSAEELVEIAGRVCYMSFGADQSPRSNAEYIANLVHMGHESVLEHAVWTLAIADVSRAFTHQLVRHRPGFAFSQLSQQYHDERAAEFIKPVGLEVDTEIEEVWRSAVEHSSAAYAKIVEAIESSGPLPGEDAKEMRRRARSAARSVLPEATRTTIVVSANARSWRHFLDVRGATIGDREMRIVSALVLRALKPTAPALFSDFVEEGFQDGLPVVRRV